MKHPNLHSVRTSHIPANDVPRAHGWLKEALKVHIIGVTTVIIQISVRFIIIKPREELGHVHRHPQTTPNGSLAEGDGGASAQVRRVDGARDAQIGQVGVAENGLE